MRTTKMMLVILFILATSVLTTVVSASNGDVPTRTIRVAHGVHIRPIGNPTWIPVDFHLFSAPIGTEASGFEEFFHETMPDLLPPPNHVLIPWTGIFPGAAHSGPYNTEFAAGVEANGFREGVRFRRSEFDEGMGVMIVWMTVPRPGVTGSSPDSAAGPIIPHSLFPIHVEGTATRNRVAFDPYLVATEIPTLDALGYPGYDGHSHFPMFVTTNLEVHNLYGLPPVKVNGSYVYWIRMTDQTGNGWRIRAHFTVTP